jgi:hypothetical protein
MRRRPVARTVGRTALIAGTATAVSGRVAARQGAQAQAAQAQAAQAQAAQAQPVAAPPPAPAANPNAPTSVEQLTALAALREQGVLTDAEFESEKAKILNR